jgi:hypothetical protein
MRTLHGSIQSLTPRRSRVYLGPYSASSMGVYPVSTQVNSVRSNGAEPPVAMGGHVAALSPVSTA